MQLRSFMLSIVAVLALTLGTTGCTVIFQKGNQKVASRPQKRPLRDKISGHGFPKSGSLQTH